MSAVDNSISAFVEATNRNDMASLAAMLHADFVDHTPSPGQSPGDIGELGFEGGDDLGQLRADVGGVGLSEDRADRGGDHVR